MYFCDSIINVFLGMWLKKWRQRYFILKGNKLYFTSSPGVPPHGVIDLSECLTVKSADEKINKRYFYVV